MSEDVSVSKLAPAQWGFPGLLARSLPDYITMLLRDVCCSQEARLQRLERRSGKASDRQQSKVMAVIDDNTIAQARLVIPFICGNRSPFHSSVHTLRLDRH
jgi:hypothetical protein